MQKSGRAWSDYIRFATTAYCCRDIFSLTGDELRKEFWLVVNDPAELYVVVPFCVPHRHGLAFRPFGCFVGVFTPRACPIVNVGLTPTKILNSGALIADTAPPIPRFAEWSNVLEMSIVCWKSGPDICTPVAGCPLEITTPHSSLTSISACCATYSRALQNSGLSSVVYEPRWITCPLYRFQSAMRELGSVTERADSIHSICFSELSTRDTVLTTDLTLSWASPALAVAESDSILAALASSWAVLADLAALPASSVAIASKVLLKPWRMSSADEVPASNIPSPSTPTITSNHPSLSSFLCHSIRGAALNAPLSTSTYGLPVDSKCSIPSIATPTSTMTVHVSSK